MFRRFCKFVESDYWLRKVCPSVRLSVRPHETIRRSLDCVHELLYLKISRKPVQKIKVSVKYYKNNGNFTWKPVYIMIILWRIHETGFIPNGKRRLVICESLYSRPTCLVGFPEGCRHSATASPTPWRAGSWRSCSVSPSENVIHQTRRFPGFGTKMWRNSQEQTTHLVTSAITLYYSLNTKTHRLQGVSSRQGYNQFHGSSTNISLIYYN